MRLFFRLFSKACNNCCERNYGETIFSKKLNVRENDFQGR